MDAETRHEASLGAAPKGEIRPKAPTRQGISKHYESLSIPYDSNLLLRLLPEVK